jgi:hypothetical protein
VGYWNLVLDAFVLDDKVLKIEIEGIYFLMGFY